VCCDDHVRARVSSVRETPAAPHHDHQLEHDNDDEQYDHDELDHNDVDEYDHHDDAVAVDDRRLRHLLATVFGLVSARPRVRRCRRE